MIQSTQTAVMMSTHHWHCPVVIFTPTEYGGSPECDLEDWTFSTHAEAMAAFGRDDDYYVYECEDLERLIDLEWWTVEYFTRLWGRNG